MKARHTNIGSYVSELYRVVILLGLISSQGCQEFTSVDPPKTQIITETVFNNDVTAISAISGIYHEMYSTEGFFSGDNKSIIFLTGYSSDELTNYLSNVDIEQFSNNEILETNYVIKTNVWEQAYKFIYYANSILIGLSKSEGVSQSVKDQLEGEAKFIRAFCHFYLTNLFGDIPYVTTIDYRVNNVINKTSSRDVYKYIIADLMSAQDLLSADYSFSNGERVRANKWAATALLSRVYLFTEDWANAEIQASMIISNTELYGLMDDLNKVFLKNSYESIWQLMPVVLGKNTTEANFFILSDIPSTATLNNNLIDVFETNDQRLYKWIDSIIVNNQVYYYPHKYKLTSGLSTDVEEYSMVFRLSEQYLIRAEARAQLGNYSDSRLDLNVVRHRAGLNDVVVVNEKDDVLRAIEHERQIELFCEGGHRWLDLKRTQRASLILGPEKGMEWQSTDELYPIPKSEILTNPNLAPQNLGY